MKKKDKREFRQVVRSIGRARQDVDTVLKAARLQRERSDFWEDFWRDNNYMWAFFCLLSVLLVVGLVVMFSVLILAG